MFCSLSRERRVVFTRFPKGRCGGAAWDPASVLEGADGSVV